MSEVKKIDAALVRQAAVAAWAAGRFPTLEDAFWWAAEKCPPSLPTELERPVGAEDGAVVDAMRSLLGEVVASRRTGPSVALVQVLDLEKGELRTERRP